MYITYVYTLFKMPTMETQTNTLFYVNKTFKNHMKNFILPVRPTQKLCFGQNDHPLKP